MRWLHDLTLVKAASMKKLLIFSFSQNFLELPWPEEVSVAKGGGTTAELPIKVKKQNGRWLISVGCIFGCCSEGTEEWAELQVCNPSLLPTVTDACAWQSVLEKQWKFWNDWISYALCIIAYVGIYLWLDFVVCHLNFHCFFFFLIWFFLLF